MSGKKKSSQYSQEELLALVKIKKECNAKAQAIVESLLETTTPEDFLSKVAAINQSHYADVVDERSILRICGYPLCDEALQDIPAKQYQISTKTNRVYDITERKKYCSSQCYKASEYIKCQMLTSPLWLRHLEKTPEYKLLQQ